MKSIIVGRKIITIKITNMIIKILKIFFIIYFSFPTIFDCILLHPVKSINYQPLSPILFLQPLLIKSVTNYLF